jgi:hypothetical protein
VIDELPITLSHWRSVTAAMRATTALMTSRSSGTGAGQLMFWFGAYLR